VQRLQRLAAGENAREAADMRPDPWWWDVVEFAAVGDLWAVRPKCLRRLK
jgi:hypothetical protein